MTFFHFRPALRTLIFAIPHPIPKPPALCVSNVYKLWGQYYRDVLATPDKTDHQNIRNFIKYGWEGVDFSNGIALTKKCVGDGGWDWDAESFIP